MSAKPSPKLIAAGIIAAVADFIQFSLIGASLGVLNPLNIVIDFIVGGIMVWLLGWHWAFVPSFMGEMIPGVSLVPSWTMAVFIVGMSGGGMTAPEPGAPGGTPLIMPGAMPMQPPQTQPQKQLTVPAQNAQTPH